MPLKTVDSAYAGLVSQGAITDIGVPGGLTYGLNNARQVTGYYYSHDKNLSRAYFYSGGVLQDLGDLPLFQGRDSVGYGINQRGDVVGAFGSFYGNYSSRAFLLRDGVLQDLGTFGGIHATAMAINDLGDVAGNYIDATGFERAFIQADGQLIDLSSGPTGKPGSVLAINNRRQAVGLNWKPRVRGGTRVQPHAFFYADGVLTDIHPKGKVGSSAVAINEAGDVVGNFSSSPGGTTAFVRRGGKTYSLNTLIPSDQQAQWWLVYANAINQNGQIAGSGTQGTANCRYVLSPIAGARLDPVLAVP